MKTIIIGSLCLLCALVSLAGRADFGESWLRNEWTLHFVHNQTQPRSLPASNCAQNWLLGVAAGQQGRLAEQRQAWQEALRCPTYFSLVRAALPMDVEMARLATQYHPGESRTWFWLGEAMYPTDPQAARQAYLRTVELNEGYGLAWCRLGVGYERDNNPHAAFDAFMNCCYHDDPGSNGCYGAGRMMERMGNIPQAIASYRLSRWEGALKRADELEKQLKP